MKPRHVCVPFVLLKQRHLWPFKLLYTSFIKVVKIAFNVTGWSCIRHRQRNVLAANFDGGKNPTVLLRQLVGVTKTCIVLDTSVNRERCIF